MPTSSAAPRSVLNVVYRSLETALTRQFARRYDAGLLLRLVDRSDDGRRMDLRIHCRGLMEMSVDFVATHVGGNVYDVLCTVENEASRRFSYSLPRRTGAVLSHAPYLGREIATFLLDQLEKRLGRLLLRSPTGPPRVVSTDS